MRQGIVTRKPSDNLRRTDTLRAKMRALPASETCSSQLRLSADVRSLAQALPLRMTTVIDYRSRSSAAVRR